MEFDIQIDESFAAKIIPQPIENALIVTFRPQPPPANIETVSIVVTDNDTVQLLNRQYRNIDAPTDVLSFEHISDPNFPGGDTPHLGDIIIAGPIAETQATTAGHTVQEEVILLAVHGALHLLGFDHDTPANKTQMWAVQHQVMTELGLAHIQPTEN
jgi:probable rRNA maturation factor